MTSANTMGLGQAMTTVPQLKPSCCIDFSANKSTNFSFVFSWRFSSLQHNHIAKNRNTKSSSFSSIKNRDNSGLNCCRCSSSDSNSSNVTAAATSSLEWDWNRWTRHFSEMEQAESFASVLKFQLEEAIEKEDFQEAVKLKMSIAEVTTKDSVAEIMSELKNAIEEERYHDASRLCKYTGSGLVGWWVGYSTDSEDPFGRLVQVKPGVGRFVGRSYSPRQLVTASPGTPLFEIFVVKDTDEQYVMQVVCLQRAKGVSTNSSSSLLKSVRKPSTSEVEKASAVEIQGNEVEAEKNEEKGINIEGATEEGIKSVINFLKDKIPGLKVKVMNISASEEVIEENDSVKQLMQEDDDKTSSESSEDETDNLEEIQPGGVSLEGGDDPLEEGKDLDMKLFIGGVVHNEDDTPSKDEFVRLPAEVNDMERDSFVLHIPNKSRNYESKESKAARVKVAALAAKGVSELMPPDVAKAFWSADKVSSKVSRDVREIVKLAVSQAQKQSHLPNYTNFSRITTSNNNFDPFDGLYVGAFGPYGTEVVQLRRKFGHWNADDKSSDVEFFEYVEAVKLTGDLNVPAGKVTFRAKIGKASRVSTRGMYPDELGAVATYKGQGRIAEFGFRNPQWVDGELLQLSGKGIGPYVKGADLGFLYVIPEQSFLVLFNRLQLPE
ncbi:protein EXECUTER 2, chloroplastic [Euphorbia lathyris]|uniref:protein EXECUTER 2, chloroplastic n=1 Tax=Euphorbia lathyris TaxID=212925 RepID=UPI0033131548